MKSVRPFARGFASFVAALTLLGCEAPAPSQSLETVPSPAFTTLVTAGPTTLVSTGPTTLVSADPTPSDALVTDTTISVVPPRTCTFEPAPSTGTLRLCHEGERVGTLQRALEALNFSVGPDGVDNRFGPNTELAVRRFQCSYGLVVDGIAGPATLATLDIALNDPSAIPVAPGCAG